MSVNTIAPILSGLREYGGTFYTFSSSINDSALLFSSDNIRVKFSKFACLKLPKWSNQSEQRLFRASEDIGEPLITDANNVFVKAYVQDYAENLQQFAESDRTDNTFQNSAELSFWKSLRYVSMGGTSDTDLQALQLIADSTYVKPNSTIGQKYRELSDGVNAEDYKQIVQFVGDINMLNHVKTGGQEYMEIYCHVPRDLGRVISPKFKPHDSIVFANALLPSGSGDEWIVGRETEYNNNQHNVKAIYDNPLTRQYDVSSDLENVCLDFTEFDARSNNSLRYTTDKFEFNAVLVYYDIWDATNDATRARNLYGILILDRFITSGTTSIPTLVKYAPDSIQPGNSFGFRQNIKWSNYSNQVTSEITVGNEMVGLDLYMNALQKLTDLTVEYDAMRDIVARQQAQINQLSQIVLQL